MRINQPISLPKIQGGVENTNSNQGTTSNIRLPEIDLFEHAKTDLTSLFSSRAKLLNEKGEEIRNTREMYQSKFKEYDEKANQTMDTLTQLIKVLSQIRSPK